MSHALISCLAAIAVAAWSVDCKPLLLLDHWQDTNIPEQYFDSSEEFDAQPQFTGDSSEMVTGVLVPKVYVMSFTAEQPSYDSEEDFYVRPAQIFPGRGVYSRGMPNSDVDYIDHDHEVDFESIGGMWQSPLEEFPDFHTRGQYEGNVGSFLGWRGRANQHVGGVSTRQLPRTPFRTNDRLMRGFTNREAHQSSIMPMSTNERIMGGLELVEPSVVPTNERISGLTNREAEPKMDELMGFVAQPSPIIPVSTNERMMSDGLTNKAADAKMEALQRQAVTSFLQSLVLKRKNDDQLKQELSEKKTEKSQIQDLESVKYVPHVVQI